MFGLPERLLSSTDVARLLNVTPSTLSNWRARGLIENRLPPHDYVYGSTQGEFPLWRLDTIEQWLNERNAETFARMTELRG